MLPVGRKNFPKLQARKLKVYRGPPYSSIPLFNTQTYSLSPQTNSTPPNPLLGPLSCRDFSVIDPAIVAPGLNKSWSTRVVGSRQIPISCQWHIQCSIGNHYRHAPKTDHSTTSDIAANNVAQHSNFWNTTTNYKSLFLLGGVGQWQYQK